jgi:hypothetical protein
MKKKSDYKPILVFYLTSDSVPSTKDMEQIKTKSGYENVLIFAGPEIEPRVEIVSVDKATVVEDIQKYIDTKFFEQERR